MDKRIPLISLKNINVYFNTQHTLQNIHLDLIRLLQ